MNKRIRKKRHRGEFMDFGFDVQARFKRELAQPDVDAFLDEMLPHIEELGVSAGGAVEPPTMGMFFFVGPRAVADARREAVIAWLRAHALVADVTATDLVDAWSMQAVDLETGERRSAR